MFNSNCAPLWPKNYLFVFRKGLRALRSSPFILVLFLFGFTAQVAGQSRTITGTITNIENGEPIVGATVSIKGKNLSVVSDAQGNFSIAVSKDEVLIISYVGFKNEELTIGTASTLKIQLKANGGQMDDVVVVGYGTKKRADLTGAVSSVPKTRLSQLPVTNILHAIEGSVAGVNVTTTSSVPGSSATVLIRGQNSKIRGINSS